MDNKKNRRMWDTLYIKVPIGRAYLWYVEPMPTSLHCITTQVFFIVGLDDTCMVLFHSVVEKVLKENPC